MKQKVIYILLTLIIIALISTSFIGIFQKPQKKPTNPIHILSNIASNNNIILPHSYTTKHLPLKHNFPNKQSLYKYTNEKQSAEIIKNIIESFHFPYLKQIIHPMLDENKTIITFQVDLQENNFTIIPKFLLFHEKVKNKLKNEKNMIKAISEIQKLSENCSIEYNQHDISFFTQDKKKHIDFNLLCYEYGLQSPIKQNNTTLFFSIITETKKGYFQTHNITKEIFHSILFNDILSVHN